jgi:hypothetical protein
MVLGIPKKSAFKCVWVEFTTFLLWYVHPDFTSEHANVTQERFVASKDFEGCLGIRDSSGSDAIEDIAGIDKCVGPV